MTELLLSILMIYGTVLLLSFSNNAVSKVIWSPLFILIIINKVINKIIDNTEGIVSLIQIILNAAKFTAYTGVVGIMLAQYESGSDNEVVVRALLYLLIVLGCIEIIQSIVSSLESRKKRLKKLCIYLGFVLIFSFIIIKWYKQFLNVE